MRQPRQTQAFVAGSSRAGRVLAVTLHNMGIQDRVIVLFHAFMWLRVSVAPDSADATRARASSLALLLVTLLTLLMTRGEVLPAGLRRALVYRIGMFAPMVASYFTLRALLPSLQPELCDARLMAIDELIFAATPAAVLDHFVNPWTVEWFAFFYYFYFYLLGVHLIGSILLDRGRRLYEILFGAMIVVAAGHTLYTFVPGVGPYAYYADIFQHELEGGFWWRQVQSAVQSAGAQYDIFPSLHTAFPTFFALHAFRHRRRFPYRYTWHLTAFLAANIVIATLFLRWHYGIDVLAGLCLAFGAQRLAIGAYKLELTRGSRGDDRQPIWEPLLPDRIRQRRPARTPSVRTSER